MNGKSICVILILVWCDVTSCDVYSEKMYKLGSSIVLASKTTLGDKVRIQVEVIVTSSDDVIWQMNDIILNAKANDSMFGTSYRKLDNTILFTLETNTNAKYVALVTNNDDDVVTRSAINMTAEDGTTYYNLSTCQPSFSEISETSVNATFRCRPELDPRDSWSMKVGIYGIEESDTSNVVERSMLNERRKTKYANLTLERGTTAKANIVCSMEIMKKMGYFLFLFTSLTSQSSGVVASTSYRAFHDISRTKTPDEFKFLHFYPRKLLEGEPFTIIYNALGRNPHPVAIYKDGEKIRKSEAVTRVQITSHVWSSSYITYRHASKESTGNYSCVAEKNGKKVVSPLYTEIKLSPRFRWDLSTTLENDPSLACVLYAIGAYVYNCSINGSLSVIYTRNK